MTPVTLCLLIITVALSVSDGSAECGVPPITPIEDGVASRVINGDVARPFSWPWQAAIYGFGFNCGGSLIDNQWVLTAGHCVKLVPDALVKIKLGVFDRSKQEAGSVTAKVAEVHRHPNYTIVGGNLYAENDIALIKLSEPVQYSDQIQPACLPADDGGTVVNDPKQIAFATGWGKTQNSGGVSSRLMQASIPFVPGDQCKKLYVDYHDAVNPQLMICAGGADKSVCNASAVCRDDCVGDSGGPLVHKVSGKYYQYGISSFVADKCFDGKHPSVFTKVQHYCDFVEKTVGKKMCAAA